MTLCNDGAGGDIDDVLEALELRFPAEERNYVLLRLWKQAQYEFWCHREVLSLLAGVLLEKGELDREEVLQIVEECSEDKIEIDERVRNLVVVLDTNPGIDTFSSCGGHPDPQRGQHKEGEFCINFSLKYTEAGWHALWRITQAIWEIDHERISLTPWPDGDGDIIGLAFELLGVDGADPDDLAVSIMAFWVGHRELLR